MLIKRVSYTTYKNAGCLLLYLTALRQDGGLPLTTQEVWGGGAWLRNTLSSLANLLMTTLLELG